MKLAQTISRFIEMAEIETRKIDDSVLFSLLRHHLAAV
jgi:hypothetical protein